MSSSSNNSNNKKNFNLGKKLSSFELNFVESTQISNNNLEHVPLTDNLIELDNKIFSKNNTKPRNFKMSTIDTNNETNSNNNNTNQTMTNNNFNFNSPNMLNISRQNFRNTSNYLSSMELYRLKLSRSKLKAVTRTSALLSGFAMVAMVELALDYSDYFEAMKQVENKKASLTFTTSRNTPNSTAINNQTFSTETTSTTTAYNSVDIQKFLVPESVLILYSFVTCLLVGVHMLALMISTCILPQLEASSFDHIEFEQQLYRHEYNILNQTLNQENNNYNDKTHINGIGNNEGSSLFINKNGLNNLNDTDIVFPYKKFHRFIELAWISSTVFGIFLFLVEIGLVCYIKFYPISFIAALTGAIVMTPILIIFVIFTITFYKRLADFKVNLTKNYFNQVNRHLLPLHDHVI